MKYKSILAVAIATLATLGASLSSHALTTFVSWGGDYFQNGTNDLSMISSGTIAVPTGVLRPYSDSIAISPASARYRDGDSYKFYGTVLLATQEGTGGGTLQARVLYNGGQNRIHINSLTGSATNHANVQGMFAWKKEDFLNGGNALDKISLSSLNSFSVNVPNARGNSTVRFAVQNAGVWYLSEASLKGNLYGTPLGTLTLGDLASTKWGVWDPTATSTGLNPPPTDFNTLATQLDDITAVGFWFNADYTGSNAAILDFDSFAVIAIPEPGSVALLGMAGVAFCLGARRLW